MLEPNFNPFPELKTERLLLRRMTLEDAPEVFFLRSDETVLLYINKEKAKSVKDAEDFIMRINENIDGNSAIQWAITLQENPRKLIGNICLWQLQKEHDRAEIGYVLHPAFWKKGIMKEAIREVIGYGFGTLKLHSIEACINPGNIASASVLTSSGFVREAYFKEDFIFEGKFYDTAVYSRLQ